MSNILVMYPPSVLSVDPTVPWAFKIPGGSSWLPPSTQTQGLAEALAYAQSNRWQFRCEGGQDNANPAMTFLCLGSPVSIGPNRNAHLVFNGVHMIFAVSVTADCLLIDSQMISEVEFNGGEIVGYPGNGASVVRLWPQTNNVPGDPVKGIGSWRCKLPAISVGNYAGRTGQICLRFTPGDGDSGIAGGLIEVGEINGSGVAGSQGIIVDAPAGTGTFSMNHIVSTAGIHACDGQLVNIGNGSGTRIFCNKWDLKLYPSAGKLALATYGIGDVFDVLMQGNNAGEQGIVEIGWPNIFRGSIKSITSPLPYPRTGSNYAGLLTI